MMQSLHINFIDTGNDIDYAKLVADLIKEGGFVGVTLHGDERFFKMSPLEYYQKKQLDE